MTGQTIKYIKVDTKIKKKEYRKAYYSMNKEKFKTTDRPNEAERYREIDRIWKETGWFVEPKK